MARQYHCGLDAAMDVIGGKWKALILWALHSGDRRFGELRREVDGISEKMLIQQLREMEARGIVHREVFHEVPPKVVYSLTPLGRSLNEALLPLGEWGQDNVDAIAATAPEPATAKRGAGSGSKTGAPGGSKVGTPAA
ncbi:winged helix-turn-helix transcriptional regulator [Embleya sp. NBC_00896]|uniref:winged helix-turn-helix transcriptional regulator n=1 Tax=Embleya sp. NBC_00896 TaxID=2975961 RepID=UPI00386788F7|nr:helix-turn-helix transcriptional regulator [Embleya sp. NBC_00896]